ncbi:serine/threonine-protein kinase 11-interacting protein isoform X2 [Ceratina calcarata]|uniref:Serine/threonine-protein kinase 11-interacting protein n=1 Tax=Ceratina calcarata TaxID=156304 RepID=A0AAJ7JDY3_9HYME|nr:serine/threonine-protein kinase 11-interacting protein isoform X2 [Ceratina calcarata]
MNNFHDDIDMKEILQLGKLLRENGDKILNSSSKLSLSTTLLHNLNMAFSLIVDQYDDLEASFQVCNSSKIDVFRHLKFLHDFVQKTRGLKVTCCPNNPNVPVDITKFRHLKYLELKKINIDSVRGLQGVRGQLESVVCAGRRGVSNVKQLLVSCGGDAGIGFVWGSLKHLALPHNALEKLDASLELAPWLQAIDLSHNLLTSAEEIFCLPNVKYVNLGYNRLEMISVSNKAASHTLRVLVLKNNYMENLNGLQNLECLTELDLSYNCLTEHSVLWPLENMSTLLWVCLEGNPLAYHPLHRSKSMKYLHPILADSEFVLDHLPLSRTEKQAVKENRQFTIRSEQSASSEFLASMSSVNSNSLSASIDTTNISDFVAAKSVEGTSSSSMERSFFKKRNRIKEAIIAEDEQEKKESQVSASYSGASKDHLEVKKQILAVRKRFGEENWLSSHAGTFVQDIMGFEPSSCPALTPESTLRNLDTADSVQDTRDSAVLSIQNAQRTETNEDSSAKDVNEVSDGKDEGIVLAEEENSPEVLLSANDVTKLLLNESESGYDPDEETGELYLVQKKKNEDEMEDLFLIITADDIKERDSITGKLKSSWSTSSVLSCVLGRSEPVTVDIIFDTTRENRQNRRYYVEPDIAKTIVEVIGERMKKRPILLKVFKCMKCSTHFSEDTEYLTFVGSSVSNMKQLKCPTCKSTLVVETDELSTMDTEHDDSEHAMRPENTVRPHLKHSESFSSIGGTEGGPISVATSLVHFDSHIQAQVCCSATSLEESRESTPSTNALNKKYESDIEVISNPSQSSIEVLDDASRTHLTPNGKRSSEERRTAVAPSLLTIPDAAAITTGLTESSSSGSLTDSICTAYENKVVRHRVNAEDAKTFNSNDKEAKLTPVTNLTSMLGGLLQSIKIGSNKQLMLKTEKAPRFTTNNIQYCYTDFSSIDHRLKLHIVLNVFEHEKEELILLLRAEILMQNSEDTFPGCLILSTSKVYVLKIDGPEGEDPQRWLRKQMSWTIDRLRRLSPIPFKQGVLVELEQPNRTDEELDSAITFLCVLQDFQRTLNFLFYVTDYLLPPICDQVELTVPDHYTTAMHRSLKNSKSYQDGDNVRQLALFSSASFKHHDLEVQLKLSSLIVTASVLVICNVQWLLPGSKELPRIIREQAMSNLVGVEQCGSLLTLNFLDEVAGREESWVLEFVSVNAADIVITSVRSPWEELFSIPLQHTVHKPENA